MGASQSARSLVVAQFPALPLWTDAYLADTSHLSALEHGAYLLLLMAMWRAGGSLVLNRITRLRPEQWRRIRPTLARFLTVSADGTTLTQGRLSDELAYVREHSRAQAGKARARWARRSAEAERGAPPAPSPDPGSPAKPLADNDGGDEAASSRHYRSDAPTPTPTPTPKKTEPGGSVSEPSSDVTRSGVRKPYPAAFEDAWKAYPTDANMSKADAFKEWSRLDAADRATLAMSLPHYRQYCRARPDYRAKHMDGYIRSRRFEGHSGGNATAAATPEDWARRLGNARTQGWWSTPSWGPMPGLAGCRVPAELLRPGDGAGWREWVPGRGGG